MRAIKFKQVTNNVAEHQDKYTTLPAYYGQLGSDPKETGLVTCFELTDEELENVIKYRKIWHSQLTFGSPMQPIQMYVCNDIFNPDADNEPVKPKPDKKIIDIEKLPDVFRGIIPARGETVTDRVVVTNNEKQVAIIVFHHGMKTWTFEIDNFPGQKRYYQTNFPITSYEQFQSECARIGINLSFISDEEAE